MIAGGQVCRKHGEHHIRRTGNGLDREQIPDRQTGEQGQHVKIGRRVIANFQPYGGQPAVLAERFKPRVEELLVIARFQRKEEQPHGQGDRCGNRQERGILRALRDSRHTLTVHAVASSLL